VAHPHGSADRPRHGGRAPAANNASVKIKNFGQMDDRFYRGAQPDKKDYKDLAAWESNDY
jgi:hypothetical protein